MSETKYLSDGRKVVVIGALNNNETIVQEIFVTKTGDEIPSGERFVVKSLHDSPVISYAKKQEIKQKERLAELEKQKDSLVMEIKNMRVKQKALKQMLQSSTTAINMLKDDDLNTFTAVISGTTQWIVKDGYGIEPPKKFDDEIEQWDTWGTRRYEGIKLISLFGNSDGNIGYRLHQYSDGSGGSTKFIPFDSYDEAIDYIKDIAVNKINEDKLASYDYEKCLAMEITFSPETVRKYAANRKKEIFTQLKAEKKAIDKLMDKMASLSKEAEGLE